MAGYDDEITVALTANATQLQEGMAQASASITNMQATVAQEAAAFNAAVQTKVDALTRLNTAFGSNVASAEGMAEAEAALDQAMNAGAITAGEYAGYVATLDAAEAAMATTAQAATAAIVEQNTALSISGSVAREVGVMIGELARGNYTRLEGSSITLANRTGLLSTALNAVLSPLGLLTVAAAAVGYSIFEAGQDFEKMEGTVLATGQAAGFTAGQLVGMADRIGESTGSISNATDAVQKLALSGRFAGQDLQLVAQAASDMAQLTGESIQSCIAQIEKLQEDPLKAVAKLNDQFHFLTVAQYEQMESLANAGDTMGAASIAYGAMADKMQGRSDEANQHVNILVQSLRDLKTVWSESMQELDHGLGGGDDAYGINEAKQLLVTLKEQQKYAEETGSSTLPGITAQIQRQQQVVDQLTKQFQSQATAAAAVGQAAQKSAQQIDEMAKKSKSSGSDTQAAQQDRERYEQMEIDRNLSLQQEKDYWTQIKNEAKDGSAEYRQALQQLVEIHRKEGEAAKEAARQSVEARKQASAATMNDLEVQREETRAASEERIQIDAQMTDKASQLYGQDSEQFRRALSQRLADSKAFVDAYLSDQKKVEEQVEQIYKDENATAIKAVSDLYTARAKSAQEELQLGQITGAQEIDMLRQYADQEYETEMGILEHYRELMADKPRVVETINKQIEALELQHNQRMMQIDDQALKQQTQMWQQRLRPISQAFDQSIMGMIQGTQTLQQGVQRMLQSILLSYVRMGIQSVQTWVQNELAKTAATTAGTATRTRLTESAAAESKASDAATAQSSVGSAAASGAAQAYQAVVGIPIVGPILAPVAAATAFAGIEAFGSDISSASGGWDRVPFDDAPALLHRNEMVLPAHLAENVRNMTGGGAGDTHNHYHISATDSKSFHQQLMSDPRMLAKAGKVAMRAARKR